MRFTAWLAWGLVAFAALATTLHAENEEPDQKFEFQAEVSRLMDILINSLYANKDVFLRELLSNASDALDRIRFMSVKDDSVLGEGEDRELEIRISYDRDARTLTLRDRGAGMTRQELINNLGTVAKSGTTAFVEAMASGADMSMIGQFGVGFYSVYLAADKVVVTSKSNSDPDQWIWTSQADSTFTVRKDAEGNTLGRGTSITLHMKEDADEYLVESKLEQIIKKYSEFIAYPIYLHKRKDEHVDDEDAPEPAADEERKQKVISSWSWSVVNDQPAIWTRSKEDVTDEQYQAFYKSFTKDYSDALDWIHFKAEGEIEFKALLFTPKVAPIGMYDNYYSKSSSLKLYVRRVMITDEFEDLMPRYLSFIKGVVDSDDLPLNVSREQLQQHKIVKVIGKKLVRKVLEMLKQLSDEDVKARAAVRAGEEPEEHEKDTKFKSIWDNFGKSFKLGVLEDAPNKLRLAKMVRFPTTKHAVSTFEEYVKRMPKWQTNIFFLAGTELDEVKRSPFLERAAAKGVEVILFSEALDEYLVQNMPEFDGKKLQNLAKEGLKFGDESTEDRALEEHYKDEYQSMCTWLKQLFGDQVEKVVVGSRVVGSPSIIVTSQFGHSANMEKIMRAQTMGDADRMKGMAAKKVMELNPRHPIIAELKKRMGSDEALAKDLAWLLFDVARLNSGFEIGNPADFAQRMFRLMQTSLDLSSLDLLQPADLTTNDEDEVATDLDSKQEL
ncbi:hypothetical protein BASA81_005744 [Batrachochytrium salamandrivorans]|nr:hypothetical protein BASA81_005744 [Batrachochytrium salamandrivorans]